MTRLRFQGRRPPRRREGGAVLFVSLILLVVLTLIGVSAMNTTQLEEKMAANSQEAARAFHTAETGLTLAFNDNDAWDISGQYTAQVDTADGPDADTTAEGKTELATTFLGFAPPPPGSLYSATSFQSANFDFESDACTSGTVTDANSDGSIMDDCRDAGGLTVTVHGGAYQIAPKQN